MKYMLLIYGNAEAWQDMYGPERDSIIQAHADVVAELTTRGELVSNQGLTAEGSAVVRFREGALTTTDGPFSEAKEVLAGFYLVDVADLDRAKEIAAKLPEARKSLIEVRRVMESQEVMDGVRGASTSG
jgi:hypothetical protein